MEIKNNVKKYDVHSKCNKQGLDLVSIAFNALKLLLMCQKSSNVGFLKLKKYVPISSKRRKSS